jgi:hypothetical protein
MFVAKARHTPTDRYNGIMIIAIKNALPPEGYAPSLATALERRHPWLAQWFATRIATVFEWPWRVHGCTPSEGLELRLAKYPSNSDLPIGAALGPYLAGVTDTNQRVWLIDMCSTVIGQDRAALVALPDLDISAEESKALWQVALPLFDDATAGFTLEPLSTGRARLDGPLPNPEKSISPMALNGQDIGDWWPTGPLWQPWRRLLNELQMTWHEHPVNEARSARGQAPINGVWLYGGGMGWQPASHSPTTWCDELTQAARDGDWHQWVESWQALQSTLLSADPAAEVILLGTDRTVSLRVAPKKWWQAVIGVGKPKPWTTCLNQS